MSRPPAPRSLLVEHAALPRPFDSPSNENPAIDVASLDRDGRLRVAVQLLALAALLAEFDLWLPQWSLRRVRVTIDNDTVRALVSAIPVPMSRIWAGLGGGERAAERGRRAVLDAVRSLCDLDDDLVLPGARELGFTLDGVIERLLDQLPRPLDRGTAEALWMIRWSLPPIPDAGDTGLFELADRAVATRIAAAAWASVARRRQGASLLLARAGGPPHPVAEQPGSPHLRVVCGDIDEDWLRRVIEQSGTGRGATLAVGRFPDGWRLPAAPVFDTARLAGRLAVIGIPTARRVHWLDGNNGQFDPSSEEDRHWLTCSASMLFAEQPRRRRGRFQELVRVARLSSDGLPTERALALAGCDRELLDEAEVAGAVAVRRGRVLAPCPAALQVDPLQIEVAELVAGDEQRAILHRALSAGDTGELLAWARAQLDELRADEVRRLLGSVASGCLGPGVQVALAEACLSLADIHGAERALVGLGPEVAGPWRRWLELLDRPPGHEVEIPDDRDLRHAPRACAEIARVAVRRALGSNRDATARGVAVVRAATEHLNGAARRWMEIRLAALLEPELLDDPVWRRSKTSGHPELVGLVLFESSLRATWDGRRRLAERLLRRVIAAERSPGRLAFMHVNLGALAFDEGHPRLAEALNLRALRFFQAAGFRHRSWEVLHGLAVANIDQLRIERARDRLDQLAAGRDSLAVETERARLELATGNLEIFGRLLEELPRPDQVREPLLLEALCLLHGVRTLLLGSPTKALPILRNGGQEAKAWIELADALSSSGVTGDSPLESEDDWGIRRAAGMIRRIRTGGSLEGSVEGPASAMDPGNALAVALVRYLGEARAWPDRRKRHEIAIRLDEAGLTGWAATLRWEAEDVTELLGALGDLVRGREPELWSESRGRALLDLLGVDGVVVRTLRGGRERWRYGEGTPQPARVHGRLELVPLGREPSPGPGWQLFVDLVRLAIPAHSAPRGVSDGADVRLDGTSAALRQLKNEVRQVAGTLFTILIHGETGSGKEVVAREIHRLSGRSGDLVSVNIAAIPENLLEAELFGSVRGAFTGADRSRRGLVVAANGGTLFLDEVGDLDPALQVKLLRFLESGEIRAVGSDRLTIVDVRVICATHRNLERRVREGHFRQDLYYRMAVARVSVPPLRDRVEDIPHLVAVFEREAAGRHGVPIATWSPAAEQALRDHGWPGNVRELKHIVEVAMTRAGGGVIVPEHLSIVRSVPSPRGTWEQVLTSCKHRLLVSVLTRHRGNRSAAARELGITRQALLYQLKSLRLIDL
jgi:transcriptional regulator with AAA-type ATPase domain